MLVKRNPNGTIKSAVHMPRRNAGALVNTIRTIAENGPLIADIASKGYKLGSKAGAALTSAAKGVNGLFTSRRKKAEAKRVDLNNESGMGTQSQNRATAPTSLSLKFDGPEYTFGACSFQGMKGLRLRAKFVYCSVEQNTTTSLHGALRSIQLAGVAGDTSMSASMFSPVATYVAGTTKGRCSMAQTILYSMAVVFRKYRVTGLAFKYESELPTTTAGGLALAFSADAAEGLNYTAMEIAQFGCSLITSVWDDALLDCSKAIDKSLKNTIPYGSSITTILAEIIAPGTLLGVLDQAMTANQVCGKIICEADVELYNPGPIVSSYAEVLHNEAKKRDAEAKVYLEMAAKCQAAQQAKDELASIEAVEYFEVKSSSQNGPQTLPAVAKQMTTVPYLTFPRV